MTRLFYHDGYDEAADKKQVHRILVALDAAATQFHRNECGAWTVQGKRGYLATWGDAGNTKWFVYCQARTKGKWGRIRRALTAWGKCTQDGDDEGIVMFDHLPTPDEAILLRKAVGFRKRQPTPATAFGPGGIHAKAS